MATTTQPTLQKKPTATGAGGSATAAAAANTNNNNNVPKIPHPLNELPSTSALLMGTSPLLIDTPSMATASFSTNSNSNSNESNVFKFGFVFSTFNPPNGDSEWLSVEEGDIVKVFFFDDRDSATTVNAKKKTGYYWGTLVTHDNDEELEGIPPSSPTDEKQPIAFGFFPKVNVNILTDEEVSMELNVSPLLGGGGMEMVKSATSSPELKESSSSTATGSVAVIGVGINAASVNGKTSSWFNKYSWNSNDPNAVPPMHSQQASSVTVNGPQNPSTSASTGPNGQQKSTSTNSNLIRRISSTNSPSFSVGNTSSTPTASAATPSSSQPTSQLVSKRSRAPGQRLLWSDYINNPALLASLNLPKQELKRQEVIYEIITTESDYIQDLETILELYIRPLQKNKLVRPKDMSIIFSNIEQFLPVNQELLRALLHKQSSAPVPGVVGEIGDTLIRVSDYLKMYTMYCSNHPYAVLKLQSVKSASRSVAKFFDGAATHPDSRNMDLGSFLLKPIQRVCKYPLLVRDLLRTTDPSHPDAASLNKALLKIETVVAAINEGARHTENVQKIIELQAKFNTKVSLVAPSRLLIKSSLINAYNATGIKRQREVYIFNDILIIAKVEGGDKLKLLHMAGLDVISFTVPPGGPLAPKDGDDTSSTTSAGAAGTSSSNGNGEFQLEIVHIGHGDVMLLFETFAGREAWMGILGKAVDDFVSQKNRIEGITTTSNGLFASKSIEVLSNQNLMKSEPSSSSLVATPLAQVQTPVLHTRIPSTTSTTTDSPITQRRKASSAIPTTSTVSALRNNLEASLVKGGPPPIPAHRDSGTTPPVLVPSPASLVDIPPLTVVHARSATAPPKLPPKPSPSQTNFPLVTPAAAANSIPPALSSQIPLPSSMYIPLKSTLSPTKIAPPIPQKKFNLPTPSALTIPAAFTVAAPQQSSPSANGGQSPIRLHTSSLSAAEQDQPTLIPLTSSPNAFSNSLKKSKTISTSNSSLNEKLAGMGGTSSRGSSREDLSLGSPTSSLPRQFPTTITNVTLATTGGVGLSKIPKSSQTIKLNRPVKSCAILDISRSVKGTSTTYTYGLEVTYITPGADPSTISRRFEDFVELHIQLLGHFPESASCPSSTRTVSNTQINVATGEKMLPDLPAQMMFVSEAVALARIPGLQAYIDKLLTMPLKISRSPLVLKFFKP